MVRYHQSMTGRREAVRKKPERETAMVQAYLKEETVKPTPRGWRALGDPAPPACSAKLRYEKSRKKTEKTNADGNKLLSVSKSSTLAAWCGPVPSGGVGVDYSPDFLGNILAGTPTASLPSGTFLVTTAPAPVAALGPTVTGATSMVSQPMKAPSPMTVGSLSRPS